MCAKPSDGSYTGAHAIGGGDDGGGVVVVIHCAEMNTWSDLVGCWLLGVPYIHTRAGRVDC